MPSNTIGQTYHIRVFAYNNQLPRQIIVPDNLTLSVYDPNNILVYSDNKPIPLPINDPNNSNISTTEYLFSIPGTTFAIGAPESAPYTAIVSAPFMGNMYRSSLPITID